MPFKHIEYVRLTCGGEGGWPLKHSAPSPNPIHRKKLNLWHGQADSNISMISVTFLSASLYPSPEPSREVPT